MQELKRAQHGVSATPQYDAASTVPPKVELTSKSMRIVLSRKGFDAANGGGPSPIFPDGRLLSLPIPSRGAPVTYADITGCGQRLDRIVEDLSGGRIRGNQPAHLDPDLSRPSLPRLEGWRAAFGQVEAAQAH